MTATAWTDGRAQPGTAEHPDLRIAAAGTRRYHGLEDSPLTSPIADPSIETLVQLATDAGESSGWLLSAGEPTLRADLPALLEALAEAGAPRLGIFTDGLVLVSESVVASLMDAGLQRVRIPFHSGRPDAHDWIVGQPGAARRVHRALRVCAAAGLEVEVETLVTRPTGAHLEETAEILARLRVESIHFRRLSSRGGAAATFVAASPRMGVVQPLLEAAVRVAEGWGVRAALHHFPMCAVTGVSHAIVPSDAEQWLVPEENDWLAIGSELSAPPTERGCAICPGRPTCSGAPSDYVERFDRLEIDSQAVADVGTQTPTDEELAWTKHSASRTPPRPPVRAGRTTATRVGFIRKQLTREIHGDPMAGMEIQPLPDAISVAFGGPSRIVNCHTCGDAGPEEIEPTRRIRVRLVRRSQEGADVLRLASAASLSHPHAAELLRDMTRLSVPKIEFAGEASALEDMSDVDLRRLRRRVHRFDVALYGPNAGRHDAHIGVPGAFDATRRVVERLQTFARVKAGAYAILHSADDVADYALAWKDALLPGVPAFRLSPLGDSLDALSDAAKALPAGDTKDALAAHIPPCLLGRGEDVAPARSWDAVHSGRIEQASHSGSDRYGLFAPCRMAEACTAAHQCPGIADGWSAAGLEPIG